MRRSSAARRGIALAIAVGIAGSIAGCSSPLLVWRTFPPDTTIRARVEVVVDDVRPERRGGRDHRLIGNELSAIGVPMHLRLRDELETSRRLRALVEAALATRGIGAPVANAFTKVRLGVEIGELWCAATESGGYAAQAALVVHVLGMPRGEVFATERFAHRVEEKRNCAVAYRALLDVMTEQLAGAAGQSPLRELLLGETAGVVTGQISTGRSGVREDGGS